MHNRDLAEDYIFRAGNRLAALDILMQRQSFADVVREAQEVVELCLKALLRKSGVEVPRIHDVGEVLKTEADRLPADLKPMVEQMAAISKQMRRDRELAFYGTEDLTPSEFYEEVDAKTALEGAKQVYSLCRTVFK